LKDWGSRDASCPPSGVTANLGVDEFDELARISEDDKRFAAASWRRYLPRRFRDLLDARPLRREPPVD